MSETNRYRTANGKAVVARSTALEAYADAGAKVDGRGSVPHQHFSSGADGALALAENELHRIPLVLFNSSVQNAIAQGIAAFFGEGPGGGHYQNLMGPYLEVGCGVFIASGEITVVQDFR